jgi:hypothetical protein
MELEIEWFFCFHRLIATFIVFFDDWLLEPFFRKLQHIEQCKALKRCNFFTNSEQFRTLAPAQDYP